MHHCYILDHKANLFEQGHLEVRDGKTFVNGKEIKEGHFHIIKGLEPTQEVAWSNVHAIELGIVIKHLSSGATLKEKAKKW